jgi:hypothetical protein
MAKYFANNSMGGSQQALSGTYKSLLGMTAATALLRRGKIYDVLFGTNGTPADNYVEYDLSQQTTAGTPTVVTLKANDQADGTPGTVGSANYTAEGTITANSSALYVGVNQRASYRWVAAPGGEIVFPATNLAGYAFRARSAAYTGTATCAMHVDEQ